MQTATGIFALLAAAIFLSPAEARAQDRTECIEQAINLDIEAKIGFQRGLHELIVTARPRFAELAGISRDLQIALFCDRAAKQRYLLQHDPDRVQTKAGVSAFSNFVWSDRDQAAFVAESAENAAMSAETERLRKRNDGHPDWDELRAFVAAELAPTPEFQVLTGALLTDSIRVGEILSSCGAP